MLSWTSFFLYKFFAPNRTQLYLVQETCMHMIKIVRFNLLAVFLLESCLLSAIVVQASYTRHLYELASNFDTRNLSKFLIPVFGTRLS